MTHSNFENSNLGTLWELYIQFRDSGDDRGARRLFKLLEKSYKNWHAACFCGHFSAGKSTLLNTLLSEDLLPTSPVPTSGNLVRLEPGPESVRVVYKDGETAIMNPPYNSEKLKEWCKNTQEIDEVRIQMGDTFPSDWMLFDTPGVDATDRDHQAATEDAVFLADSILFVADYNHIQSEGNFEFLDRVQRLGKPIYLIVNQIDKHQESEIPFETYKARIEKSLTDWGLNIERLFYLSLADLTHPHNEWDAFKAFIGELANQKAETDSLNTILEALVNDHKEWWKSVNNMEAVDSSLDLVDLQKRVTDLENEQVELNEQVDLHSVQEWIDQAKSDIHRTIESAVLTPYETRELAKSYLESIQPEFKVGFFSTKGKVAKEQEQRLDLLLEDLNKRVQTLNWQTGDTFYKVVEPLMAEKDELKRISQSLTLSIGEAFLKKQIHSGARITGAYLLTFADQLAKAIQKEMRMLINEKFDGLKEVLAKGLDQNQHGATGKLDTIASELDMMKKALNLRKQETHHFDQLDHILISQILTDDTVQQSVASLLAAPPKVKQNSIDETEPSRSTNGEGDTNSVKTPKHEEDQTKSEPTTEPLEASVLLNASLALRSAKGFKETGSDLMNRLERLENQRLTVALFGAFSAGKSSFANALLGDSVLKVSPNPTTAVVNRILPVDEAHPHGHMVLYMKSEDALLHDLHRALTPFGKEIDSLDQLNRVIRSLPELGAGYSKGKLFLAFLEAVLVGLKDHRANLGQERVVDMAVGQEIVADETQACLIDRVDLYYDCEATRKGMILVDTPGADSLNARHTETSYKYIKSADAVVFVTYYQHAFSRADETFLRQLGRIQDAFERDKFFFIVNAIDLARNPSERQQVLDFVNQQLENQGLTSPRLFGLSSLNGLRAKQQQDSQLYSDSGFSLFEADWERFVKHDLVGQTLRGAQDEFKRAAHLLNDFIEKGNMTDAERTMILEGLQSEADQAKKIVKEESVAWMGEELIKTADELFYYVKQRLSLQLTENFSRFFNPSVLRQERGSKTAVLGACLEEILNFLSDELEQEVRATGIRVEANLTKAIHSFHTQVNHHLGPDWALREPESPEWEAAPLPYDFIDLPREALTQTFKLYKNPKQFFEQNGIKEFKEALLSLLVPDMEAYLTQACELTKDTYRKELDQALLSYHSLAEKRIEHLYKQKHDSIREAKELQETYQTVLNTLVSLGVVE